MRTFLFTLIILTMGTPLFAQKDFSVGDLIIKEMGIRPGGEYIEISFKIDVNNYGIPGKISINIQGIDTEGFEVASYSLSGSFEKDESRTLTEKMLIEMQKYRKIKSWRLKDSFKLYPPPTRRRNF